jgi:MscS family membrane protein
VVVGAAVYVVMAAWEIDVSAWLASAGIVGIAVGFAARDTLANLFAGIFILADAPYKLGDFIVLDSGERGRVTDIGIRSTRLLTRDDIEITLPNAVIANAKIANETGGPYKKTRVRATVGVAYGSDIDHVREVLQGVLAECEYVEPYPEPQVRFREMGDSALVFQVRGWVAEPVLVGRTIDALNTAIYKRFAETGIEIPFPQRVVHLTKGA